MAAEAVAAAWTPERLPRLLLLLQRTITRKANKVGVEYRNYQQITHQTMHNHDHRKGMMWMMIPCLLLLGVLFFGGERLFPSSGYLWLIAIAICVVPHIWMMFRGHGGHGDSHEDHKTGASGEPETKDTNKRKGCCH